MLVFSVFVSPYIVILVAVNVYVCVNVCLTHNSVSSV